jgi:DNA invertase Pin-like site-specific DNA recombinase
MQKVALYARCSRLLGQDPEHQLVPLRQMCKQRNFEIVEEYTDFISGTKESRPALDRLVADAKRGRFAILGIYALDRASRNTKHLLNLMEELAAVNVTVVSMREGLDFSTPIGKAVLAVCGAISQLERDLISERIKIALAVKKKKAAEKGVAWRIGQKPLSSQQIDLILEEHRKGISIRRIAATVGLSKSSVQRVLANRVSQNLSKSDAASG